MFQYAIAANPKILWDKSDFLIDPHYKAELKFQIFLV